MFEIFIKCILRTTKCDSLEERKSQIFTDTKKLFIHVLEVKCERVYERVVHEIIIKKNRHCL
jgi:hypothetical protein